MTTTTLETTAAETETAVTAKTASEPQTAAEPNPATPKDQGAKAMLRLWLILTTNPYLLPKLRSTSTTPDTTPFYPLASDPTKPDPDQPKPDNPETVRNWGELYTALTAGCANPSPLFQPAALQSYLEKHFTQTAADVKGKPTFDAKGQPVLNSDGVALTYGDVYSIACQAFDGFWSPILTWGHPSPETFGEITI